MSSTNPVDASAALWVVRHQEGALTEEERARFEAWIARDVRHRGAFVRLSSVAMHVQRLSAVAAGNHASTAPELRSKRPPRQSRIPVWSVAAALAVVIAGSCVWVFDLRKEDAYVSGVGELRQIALADGSHMSLNTATETRVHYSDAAREVKLTRGEALFEVAKDPARPFVVHAGAVRIKALGTAFAVKLDGAHVDVTVTEGVVEVRGDGGANSKPKRLSANERVTATDVGFVKVEPLPEEALERALAWRQGMVAFNGETLAEAVAVINRHNRKRLTIGDPTIASRPVIGMFRADDIESFARTAAAVTGAELIENDSSIRLEARTTR